MDKKFNIIFSGKLVEGSKPPEVLQKLCVILGLEAAKVRELFKSGDGAIIRKDLDAASARELLEKLKGSGVICRVKGAEVVPPQEVPLSGMQTPNQFRPESLQRPQDQKQGWQPLQLKAKKRHWAATLFVSLLKIILLAAVAGGGWWVYQTWFATRSPAFTAYASFAEAMAHGEYQKAVDGSQGEAKAYVESWIDMMKPNSMKIYGKEYSMTPPSVNSIAGDIAWIRRKRISEENKSDSLVELQVEQTVCRIPPGVSSAICKWPVTFQHEVELQLIDGSWKVSGFKEVRLTPQDK